MAVALTILLQMALIYVPSLRQIFSTVSLSVADLAACAAAAIAIFVAVEIEKWLLRARGTGHSAVRS